MNERFAQANTMPCITFVTPTISKLIGIPPPAVSGSDCLHEVTRAAGRQGVEKVARCLIYAPDAVGRQMYQNYRSLFDGILEHAPIIVPMRSATPPITSVCYSSMFTGAQPQVHGIQKKETPVLTCDTIFDALIRSGKKIAIVAVKGSSIDLIFRKRQMRYFSEPDDQDVTRRTIEVIKSDNFDFIIAYHSEYDDILHEMTPFCPEAIDALKHHLHAFSEFSKLMDVYWQNYNRMIWFAPDHGAHIDPQRGKGTHGDNIPEDMQVQHYIGIKPGKNDVPKPN
jgi:predicted AlkP superfamily pyrophosphatase or phosphodiesterase